MNLLFFIEPFPVRGRPLDFQWIWEKWSRITPGLIAQGAICSFATSDAIKANNPAPEWRVVSPRDLGIAPEDQRADDSEWVTLMSDPVHPVWRPFVRKLLDTVDADAIVTWTVNRPLQVEAAARGIPVLHVELGSVRFPWGSSYFADPSGVNGASSLPELWPSIRARALVPHEEHELDTFVREFLRADRDEGRLTALRERWGLRAAKKTVGIFLQVPRDSNVLRWSRVAGNTALLREVARRFPAVDYQYLVKPHPADPAPIELEGSEAAIAEGCRPREVIDLSDVVCTINSSVGIEALAAEKPLYTFGASPYELEGCTRSTSEEEPGAFAPFSPDERRLTRRLLHFLFFRYLAWEDDTEEADAFGARLRRFIAWHAASASLLDWFTPSQDVARLLALRNRRRWQQTTYALTESNDRLAFANNTLAAAVAEKRALELEREQLRANVIAKDAAINELRAARAELLTQLEASQTALAGARASVGALNASLPIRAGNLLRRIPLAVSLVRLARPNRRTR